MNRGQVNTRAECSACAWPRPWLGRASRLRCSFRAGVSQVAGVVVLESLRLLSVNTTKNTEALTVMLMDSLGATLVLGCSGWLRFDPSPSLFSSYRCSAAWS